MNKFLRVVYHGFSLEFHVHDYANRYKVLRFYQAGCQLTRLIKYV